MLVELGVEIDLHLARRRAARYLSTSALPTSRPVTRNPIMNVASMTLRNPKASAPMRTVPVGIPLPEWLF